MALKIKKLTLVVLVCSVTFPSLLSANETHYRNPFPGFDPQCYADVPAIDDQTFDAMTTPIEIFSDSVSTSDQNHISFNGDVILTQGNRSLSADQTSYDRNLNYVNATGNINYKDGYITIKGASQLSTSLDSRQATLEDPSYILHGSPTHGDAKKVVYDHKNGKYHFENAKITTCPKDNESWYLTATTVDVDNNEVFGESWNTTLWVYDVPVFYLPYFNFPIKNQRKTGFLYPSVEYGKSDGLQITTPFYWNIAPNYDYTLTPKIIGRRGLLTGHEFRYMINPHHLGSVNFEYINHDRKAVRDDDYKSNRWFLSFKHHSDFLNNKIKFDVTYDRVNKDDFNYFNDLGNIKGSNDKLLQNAKLTYNPFRFTTASVEARNYQMLIDTNVKPFTLLPKISVRNTLPTNWFSLHSYGEFSNFIYTNSYKRPGNYEGKRLHLESALRIPLVQEPFLQVDGTAKLMYTKYMQDQNGPLMFYYTNQGFTSIRDNVDRFLPMLKFKANLILDTEYTLFGDMMSQTLEPHIQYLYVPYRNQDHIGLYDTTDYIQDYYSIFGDNRFAGLDRISNENRLTIGFTSRIKDSQGHERALFTIGQAFSLQNQKVKLTPYQEEKIGSRSNLNMMFELKPWEYINFVGSMAYDTINHRVYRGFSAIEYKDDTITGQLNYRYTKRGNRTMFDNKKVDLKQIGAHIAFPINDNISLMSSAFYDLEQKRNIDRIIKLQYDNCCWKFNVFLEQVNEPDNINWKAREDTKFGLHFEMKGLGSIGGKDLEHSLDTRLLPYNRPFNISE